MGTRISNLALIDPHLNTEDQGTGSRVLIQASMNPSEGVRDLGLSTKVPGPILIDMGIGTGVSSLA